jgi:hypothetical protein
MTPTYGHLWIPEGTTVYSADGAQLGTVTEANAGYIVLAEPTGLPADYFIPTSAVERATGTRAELNVSMAEMLASGWDRGQARPR